MHWPLNKFLFVCTFFASLFLWRSLYTVYYFHSKWNHFHFILLIMCCVHLMMYFFHFFYFQKMQQLHIKKSTVWYLQNLGTNSINYLNVGDFKIGRIKNKKADLKVDSEFCSKLHCTFRYSPQEDRVWLQNDVSYFKW